MVLEDETPTETSSRQLGEYRGRLLSGSRHKHLMKTKIVHLAHVLSFAWLHNTAVELQPAGESGRERRTEYMSAEENKAVVRREMEELFNHTGNLDVTEEIIAPDYVSYEPTSGETRGIEGAKQFAATYREAFPDLTCTIEDMVAE